MKLFVFGINVFLVFCLFTSYADAATYTVCSSGCNQTTIWAVFTNYDLAPDDIVEVRADTPGGTKTFGIIGAWGSNDGGSLDHHVTLRGRAGDTIIVDTAGTTNYGAYTGGVDYLTIENIEFRNALVANFYINAGSNYITFNNCSSSGTGKAIRATDSPTNITINNFISNHNTLAGPSTGIIDLGGGSNITLDNVTITQNTTDPAVGAIFLDGTSNFTMNDVEVTGSPSHGIYIVNVNSGTANFSDIYSGVTREGIAGGNIGQGIYASFTATTTMDNINIGYNTGHGLHFTGGTNPLTITNATSSYNTNDGIAILNFTGLVTLNNIYSHHNGANGVGLSTLSNFIYSNGITNYNGVDGFVTADGSIGTVTKSTSNYNGTYGHGVDLGSGDGFTSHSTDNVNYNYNITTNNYNTGFANTVTSTGKLSNNILWSNGSTTDSSISRCQLYITTTANPGFVIKNNIIGQGKIYQDSCEYRSVNSGTSYNVLDYNLYNPINNDSFKMTNSTPTSWATWHATNESNSNIGDPSFVSENNFQLGDLSPAIDAGVDVGLTSDYLGNPIYGTPDIGAYEYQPPYTIGTHDINDDGSIRIYSNGKYRYKEATSGSSIDFSVEPEDGYGTGDYSEYMDVAIDTWQTSGDQNKQWTATSTVATTTVYTIGDLLPSTEYTFKLDGTASTTAITGDTCTDGVCTSDSSGNLTFTYTGGYSTHTFALEKVPEVVASVEPSASSSGSSVRSRVNNLIEMGKLEEADKLQDQYPNAFQNKATSSIENNSPRDLELGMIGDDVKVLQIILNLLNYQIASSGPGSPSNETEKFGPLTKQALIKFQKDNNISPAVGYFGPKTREKLIQKLIEIFTN